MNVAKRIARTPKRIALALRLRSALHSRGLSFISQNCIGTRLSQLAREPYLSPNVGLWIAPAEFIEFAADLPTHLAAPLDHDEETSSSVGYPVGRVGNVRLMFQHFESFDAARDRWLARRERGNLKRTVLIMTDRDGATEADLARFDALPFRKILFVAKPRPQLQSAVTVAAGSDGRSVCDRYTDWEYLEPVLKGGTLKVLSGA